MTIIYIILYVLHHCTYCYCTLHEVLTAETELCDHFRMERDRSFNFKLLVPPRVNSGQVSAIRPQEVIKKDCDFMNTMQQFANESISTKLEEQMSENEDLRNKDNATRNLCNILKHTFQRSAEKMHLFESEREETHHLFMENSERIQKIVAVFESLQIQVESDQQEMRKVNEGLLQFEEMKDKYRAEYKLKEEEVAGLQTKLERKENELQKIHLDLHETQKHCKQLQYETDQQYKLLKSSESDRETLLQKLHTAEHDYEKTQKQYEASATAMEQRKAEYAQILQSKDLSLQELNKFKNQQAEKQEQFQTTIKDLQKALALEIQRSRQTDGELMANIKEVERTNTLLCETMEQSTKKDGHIKTLEDELDIKSKSIDSLKGKIHESEVIVKELTAMLSKKTKEAEIALSENDLLKKECEASEKAQEDLKKFALAEIKMQELEEQLLTEIKKNQEHEEHLRRDITLHEVKYEELLSSFNELLSEKMALQQQLESGSSNVKETEANMKASEEKTVKLTREIQRFEEENQSLREEVNSLKTQVQGKCQKTEMLEKILGENCEHLQEKITEKEKQIKTMETKVNNLRKKIENKLKVQEEYQKENKMLKKQIANAAAKTKHLENQISSLQDESQNLRRLHEEEQQKLLKDLEHKMSSATELDNEVQKLRLTAVEAIKNREDVELKCQHKIADMVTLMEKHKSQCDRMVEEKDAELDKNKKKEMEAVAQSKSLGLDLLKHQTENYQLKKQLKSERKQMENLQKELTCLKKEVSLIKINQPSDARSKQSPASNVKRGRRCSETPKASAAKTHVFDFTMSRNTPTYNRDGGNAALSKSMMSPKDIGNDDARPPRRLSHRTSKIRSYRIRTPPSGEKAALLGKVTVELDPKSDSPDQSDLLTFANISAVPSCKLNISQKSPITHKSPGNLLKLAAMKRMRDAGWTAVTGRDKKKRKNNETVFA
ncbi:synaptonemal complex protein 1 [Solea senegalensis]|uniref:Synaptonemal complex protein 1 n=2 Tax=Solea senegalensis TaxID=28829 RepID=A0AAV6QP99_SOLSE|nr:synaptonemal complex protein 1 [Solea senegalensis]